MSYKQNFANLINIFTVIIDQFDALLLNTSIHFLKTHRPPKK